MEENIKTCEFCGVENDWGNIHPENGYLWQCEKCGKVFCDSCGIKKVGTVWLDITGAESGSPILCPDCISR